MINTPEETRTEKGENNPPLDPEECFQNLLVHSLYQRVVERGNEKPYQIDMLFKIPEKISIEGVAQESHLLKEKVQQKGKLTLFDIVSSTRRYFCLTLMLLTASSITNLLLPFTLKLFLGWYETQHPPTSQGILRILAFALVIFARGIISAKANEFFFKISLRANNVLSWVCIKKIFTLSPSSAFYLGSGRIAVLINSDLEKLANSVSKFTHILQTILEFVFTVVILFQLIGWFLTVLTAASILTILGIQKQIFKKFRVTDEQRRENIDLRSSLTEEMVSGIKSIKLSAAEKVIMENLDKIRQKEKIQLNSMLNRVGVNLALSWNVCSIAAFVVFTVNKLMSRSFDTGTIFATIMYLSRLGSKIDFLINCYTVVNTAMISLRRVNGLLLIRGGEELERSAESAGEGLERGEIEFKNFDGSWEDFELRNQVKNISGSFEVLGCVDQKAEHDSLPVESCCDFSELERIVISDINLKVKQGMFVAIVGPVGSGKSSLLRAVGKELKTINGQVKSKGSIAMVSQQAFLINDTLKNNILFGKEYKKEKYEAVVEMCQLLPDLEILQSGDQTEVGERGINLSGGQKQRISLARAVYSDSDIYLIDDCLSALDAHVGKEILKQVILGHLRGKTILMASHHTHFLDQTDFIYILKEGRISKSGQFKEINKSALFKSMGKKTVQNNSKEIQKDNKKLKQIAITSSREEQQSIKLQTKNINNLKNENSGRLTRKEQRKIGIVDAKVIHFYISKGGFCLFFATLAIFITTSVFSVTIDWWPAQWYQDHLDLPKQGYIGTYVELIIFFLFTSILKGYIFSFFASQSSYKIYRQMLLNLLRKPLMFFDTTPSGIIMNRMTDDTEINDLDFPRQFYNVINSIFIILTSFTLMAFASYLMLIILVIFIVLMTWVFKRYLTASSELKRILRMSRSPILSTVSEMVNGITQIRLYRYENALLKKWRFFQEVSVNSQLHESYCINWVLLFMYTAFSCTSLVVGLSFLAKRKFGLMTGDSSTLVGLVMQYVLTLVNLVYSFSNSLGKFMTELCVVERLKEYCDFTEFEADFSKKKDREVSEDWPSPAKFEIENLSIRYREGLPLVIKHLNLVVKAGEKVAIVGRTGSGKSTLILALMKIIEAAVDENKEIGTISVSGVDISKLGLHKVRKAMSVIPQDPNLLNGTLRFNLDHFGLASDTEILQVLNKVKFFETIKRDKIQERGLIGLPESSQSETENQFQTATTTDQETPSEGFYPIKQILEMKIEGKGANLSVGQRQLISIAKSLLEKSNIFLMDEATASVDKKLDQQIQKVILNEMKGRTVITIAHRLETILSYDRIVVMQNGEKVEEGSPAELMEEKGIFYGMMMESGIHHL